MLAAKLIPCVFARCMCSFCCFCCQLSAHPDSAKVLDFLFASAKQKEQLSLLQEFYSPEFVVFGADESLQGKSLAEIVQAKPEKKMQMLENLRKVSLPPHKTIIFSSPVNS